VGETHPRNVPRRRVGLLPSGASKEAIPTSPPCARGLRPKNRPPPRLRRYSPSKLGEKSAPPRPSGPLPQQAGGELQRRPKNVSPVEGQLGPPRGKSEVGEGTAGGGPGVGGAPQAPGGVRPKAGRGRERSEPEACVRRTDPLPGFAGTPPASWGRNPEPCGNMTIPDSSCTIRIH